MPYKRCNQCKKRISEKISSDFCSSNCEEIYTNSEETFCKNCNSFIGKSSVTKKQFCGLKCLNEYQSKINTEEKKCIYCGKVFYTKKSSRRHKLCSIECEKKYSKSDVRNIQRMNTLKKNNKEKYGVEYTLSLESVIKRSKKTKLEKYGDENYSNYDKGKKTKLEKYGTLNFSDKAKQTKLEKYGKLSFNDKAKQTKLEKYGTLNFSDKAKQTKLEKYGTLNFSGKSQKTIKEKYGSLSELMIKKSFYRLKDKYNDSVEFLFSEEDYTGAAKYKLYPFKCKKCNNEFLDYITNGLFPICKICNPSVISKYEIEILEFLKSICDITIIERDKKVLKGKELDIYIPDKNVAIEFNGLYWHSEISGGKNKNYHIEKTELCNSIGIKLIHIFEDEWINKKEIVKNKLIHVLSINRDVKVYARKCEIKQINSKLSDQFLEKYHIQGKDKSSIKLGAFYNSKLVSVMTFGKYRKVMGNKSKLNEYEMYRFCVGSIPVVGIASKFLSYFINNYRPSKIISYADRRWSDINTFYDKINFKLIKCTVPNYWYVINKKRFYRFNFRKNVLSKKLENFDTNLSEWQNMQLNGYDRIWDCGHLKFEWIN